MACSTTSFKLLSALTFLSAAAYLVVLIMSLLTAIPNNGIFNNDVGNISDKFMTDITPADYAFSIWGVIYVWCAAWIVYAVTTIFRCNSRGRVIVNPVVLPVETHIFWIVSCLLIVVWFFVWDNENIVGATIVLLLTTICGYVAVTRSSQAVMRNKEDILAESRAELICIYVLVQNGMDILYSWTTVATVVSVSSALTYGPAGMDQSVASTVMLCILGVIVIGWSVCENTVFYDLFTYVYAWYAVLIWAFIAIITKNPDISNRNVILTIVLLSLAILCLIIKIVVYVFKPCSKYQKRGLIA